MVKKRGGEGHPVLGGVLLGTVSAVTVSVVLTAIAASLILKGQVKEEMIPTAVIGILFLSSFSGCLLAGKWVNKQIAVVCGSAGAAFTVLLLGITIFAFDAVFRNMFGGLIALLIGCVAACCVCMGKGKKRKRGSR